MSLTNDDLTKIRGVVREEVEAEVGNVKSDLEYSITRVELRNSHDLSQINNRLKNLEIGSKKLETGASKLETSVNKLETSVNKLETGVKGLEAGQRRIEKKLDFAIDFLDKQDIRVEKRIVKIEEKLNLQPAV